MIFCSVIIYLSNRGMVNGLPIRKALCRVIGIICKSHPKGLHSTCLPFDYVFPVLYFRLMNHLSVMFAFRILFSYKSFPTRFFVSTHLFHYITVCPYLSLVSLSALLKPEVFGRGSSGSKNCSPIVSSSKLRKYMTGGNGIMLRTETAPL